MYADKYGHIHHSDCRNTLISMHMTSCTLLTHDISLGPLMLPALEAGDFVELLLLYPVSISKLYCSDKRMKYLVTFLLGITNYNKHQ
jgi:hypothetical protein